MGHNVAVSPKVILKIFRSFLDDVYLVRIFTEDVCPTGKLQEFAIKHILLALE